MVNDEPTVDTSETESSTGSTEAEQPRSSLAYDAASHARLRPQSGADSGVDAGRASAEPTEIESSPPLSDRIDAAADVGSVTHEERVSGGPNRSWTRRLWWIHSIYALGLGIFISLYVGKDFSYARWLLLSAVAIWSILLAIYRLFGPKPSVESQSLAGKVGFHAMTWVVKNLYQGMLFFLLPFYWRSATYGTVNQWFVVVLAICALIATLDIIFDRFLIRFRFASTAYFLVTMFATFNLAIPALLIGVDVFYSLLGASIASVLVAWFIRVPRWRWSDVEMRGALLGGVIAAVMFSYVARPLVPPVPHHIINGAVGLAMNGQITADARAIRHDALSELVAETRILAPDGAESSFQHEWRLDGSVVHRVTDPGRMTFESDPNTVVLRSILPAPVVPKSAYGQWQIDVLTDGGRLIGRLRFNVVESFTEAP